MRIFVPPRYSEAGFTLLEMVLVLFLMALVASAGLMLTEGVEDQAKYDETKRRMEMIRKAIVGDPTRTVNGSPEISGFVADMGRLPGCLRELLEAFDCDDPPNPLTQWTIDPTTGVASGWRGPYIQVLPDRDGVRRFRDGYGNDGDDKNFGWNWAIYDDEGRDTEDAAYEPPALSVRLQSNGPDGTLKYPAGDIDAENDEDKPKELITEYDWRVNLPYKVNVVFKNQSGVDVPEVGVTQDVVLLVYGNDFSSPLAESDSATLSQSAITSNSMVIKDFNFTTSPGPIAIGNRPYVVACDKWDHDSDSGTDDEYTAFLGNGGSEGCSTESIGKDDARIFSVVPRQALHLNLDWVIE